MNRTLGGVAFVVGLLAIAWVGFGYLGNHLLALTMTLLIAACYVIGALELRRYQQATASLSAALSVIPEPLPRLGDWLDRLHPSLQNPVRLRIEGERVALPGPSMAPFLIGLLVLLGMLGTFLGMVVTLNGAVLALQSTTDLPTMRAALTAPVKGLGLAFGTSVAGVAGSAMLGLLSALCRRERLQAAQRLDSAIATRLRAFSLAHQREETLGTLQVQARLMPEVVGQLQAMMERMQRQDEASNDRLLASQEGFQRETRRVYSELAASVDRSLRQSLTDSARVAGATIQPVVEATMAGISREAALLHQGVADQVQGQLDGMSARFEQGAAAWLASAAMADAARQAEQAADEQQRLAAYSGSLQAMVATLRSEWQQAGADHLAQQQAICKSLAQTAGDLQDQARAQARDTIAEIAALVQAASQAPRAAAEVIGEWRRQLSDGMQRDNALLDERSRLMGQLANLLETVHQAAAEQRGAIDALVASSARLMQGVSREFTETIAAESGKLNQVAAQLTGSAVEVASLGEAFGFGVQLFSTSGKEMIANLQQIEAALGRSATRSDEQLAYYVAQARELIDLSISSQQQIVEDLRRLAGKPLALAGEPA